MPRKSKLRHYPSLTNQNPQEICEQPEQKSLAQRRRGRREMRQMAVVFRVLLLCALCVSARKRLIEIWHLAGFELQKASLVAA